MNPIAKRMANGAHNTAQTIRKKHTSLNGKLLATRLDTTRRASFVKRGLLGKEKNDDVG